MVDTKSPASPTIIGDTIDDATKLSLDIFTIDGLSDTHLVSFF